MSTNLTLAKLLLCAVGGAVVGGGAVHVAERPKKPKVHHVARAKKPAPPPATAQPAACETEASTGPVSQKPLIYRLGPLQATTQPQRTWPVDEELLYPDELTTPGFARDFAPPQWSRSTIPPVPGTTPADIPEPATTGLFALGGTFLVLVGVRRWYRAQRTG